MKNCILLVDYINDICHADGAFGCYPMLTANDSFNKVNQLLAKARSEQWLVVWIVVGFSPDYKDANLTSPLFSQAKLHHKFQLGSWGTEIVPYLNYQPEDLIINKNAISPFYATNLDHVLRSNQVNNLVLAGVSTEVAIQSATRDAHDRGYNVTIAADCCASRHQQRHDASLEMLTYLAKVELTEQILGRA
jgi:nicotinamidase-related amidase